MVGDLCPDSLLGVESFYCLHHPLTVPASHHVEAAVHHHCPMGNTLQQRANINKEGLFYNLFINVNQYM
jgi:hypothetical protein